MASSIEFSRTQPLNPSGPRPDGERPGGNLSVRLAAVDGDLAVVKVDGELDLSTVALLEAVLAPLPGRGIRHLLLAAEGLRFCDATGFRALAEVHAALAAAGGGLVVADPSPALRRLTWLMQRFSAAPAVPTAPADPHERRARLPSGP
ncbi:STAS domain-containing protein [Planomonospora sp. ID91781]|uniref:STAS domain-containing protein n=1 Tax=Planomonospora sp. ID91781 TaxID=2738135 RepID=UPI0018C43C2E|nr:STAS domain-containing protein [Planomonospora sp. ID91781]MBG0819623.1 STAS domain-containing protein [Planomonospora sp. ID91781]